MASAALATEPPTPELLLEKPHGRDEALISPSMWKHIFCQGVYQLFWLFLIVYGATKYVGPYKVGGIRWIWRIFPALWCLQPLHAVCTFLHNHPAVPAGVVL